MTGFKNLLRRTHMATRPEHQKRLTDFSRWTQFGLNLLRTFPYLPSSQRYNLTISHESRFVWFRVAKVGTRTILHHLQRQNVSLDLKHPYTILYPYRLYQHYFKFAFVRNPWARLVSCWQDKVINTNHFQFEEDERQRMQTFSNFINYVSGCDLEHGDNHLRLQCRLIDLNHLDFLGRMETFERDLQEVCRHLELPESEVVARNVSPGRKNYQEFYDQDLQERVGQLYRKDVQIFGYRFS